jgi:hypothetical protein
LAIPGFIYPERVESKSAAPHHRAMPQSLAKILVHTVFSTKERRPYLRDKGLRAIRQSSAQKQKDGHDNIADQGSDQQGHHQNIADPVSQRQSAITLYEFGLSYLIPHNLYARTILGVNLALKLRKPLDEGVGVLASLLQGAEEELHLRGGILPANVPVLGVDPTEMIGMEEPVFHWSNPTIV